MPRDKYNTRNKEELLRIIKTQNKDFTINDIYKESKNIGLTTVYRYIDELIKKGMMTKIIDENKKTKYQYLEKCQNENHFYLKCNTCGTITHIDCECIEELSNHILNKHNFKTDKKNIIIKGICQNCKGDKI